MNRIPFELQAQILSLLAQGMSLRGIATHLRISLNAVSRNAVWMGEACQRFHDATVVGLKPTRIEVDEAWTFIDTKDDNLPETLKKFPDYGTSYVWASTDPDSKIMCNWYVGKHELADATIFINDLARRITSRFQLHSDQLPHYRSVVEEAFGDRVDYATVQKDTTDAPKTPDGNFEQAIFLGQRCASVYGDPDMEIVTTTSIESQNTRLRCWNKRMNRRTIAFSRRLRNLRASVAIHFVYQNFCRDLPRPKRGPREKGTAATKAGLAMHKWKVEQLLEKILPYEQRDANYLNKRKAA